MTTLQCDSIMYCTVQHSKTKVVSSLIRYKGKLVCDQLGHWMAVNIQHNTSAQYLHKYYILYNVKDYYKCIATAAEALVL